MSVFLSAYLSVYSCLVCSVHQLNFHREKKDDKVPAINNYQLARLMENFRVSNTCIKHFDTAQCGHVFVYVCMLSICMCACVFVLRRSPIRKVMVEEQVLSLFLPLFFAFFTSHCSPDLS